MEQMVQKVQPGDRKEEDPKKLSRLILNRSHWSHKLVGKFNGNFDELPETEYKLE